MTTRWLDHTADLGVEVRAPDAAGCYEALVRATTVAIAGDSVIEPRQRRHVAVWGEDGAERAVALVGEIIYAWDADRFLVADARVETRGERVEAHLRGEEFDARRHDIEREVEAATHHDARFEAIAGGWLGQIIFDL